MLIINQRVSAIVALALSIVIIPLTILAALPTTSPYVVDEQKGVIIDGVLDDDVWEHAERLTEFHQTRLEDHGEPSEKTKVQLAIDTNYI